MAGRKPNSDGAVWCPEHKRYECAKTARTTKKRCHRIALAGLDNCGRSGHAGTTKDQAKAKGQANLIRQRFRDVAADYRTRRGARSAATRNAGSDQQDGCHRMTPPNEARPSQSGGRRQDERFGFPPALLDALDMLSPGPGPMSPCGFCGDTILGQRHRIIDAITERLCCGEVEAGEDYGIPAHDLWIIVAASYEHTKALAKQRRAERKRAAS